jgi:hypothetical protein
VRARQAEQDFGQIHRHRASLGEKEFVVDPQGRTKEKIYVCEALAITSSPSRTVAHATPTPSGGASTGSQRRLAQVVVLPFGGIGSCTPRTDLLRAGSKSMTIPMATLNAP